MMKKRDGNGGAVNARNSSPSSVGICVRYVVDPFIVRPFIDICLPALRMPPNPFGLKDGTVRPVGCRDDNVSVHGIIDGMEVVVIPYVVDPFDEGLIIACM